jgi:hypothetical protein
LQEDVGTGQAPAFCVVLGGTVRHSGGEDKLNAAPFAPFYCLPSEPDMDPRSDASEAVEPPRPEQTFFADPAVDRVLGVVMALAAEVYVLRDRVRVMEAQLTASGTLDGDALDREPDGTALAASRADRDAFVQHLMQPLLGQQMSKGALL